MFRSAVLRTVSIHDFGEKNIGTISPAIHLGLPRVLGDAPAEEPPRKKQKQAHGTSGVGEFFNDDAWTLRSSNHPLSRRTSRKNMIWPRGS